MQSGRSLFAEAATIRNTLSYWARMDVSARRGEGQHHLKAIPARSGCEILSLIDHPTSSLSV